jgi:hypothetical protein
MAVQWYILSISPTALGLQITKRSDIMENKKITFADFIEKMKAKQKEQMEKNPEFFQKIKAQAQKKEIPQFSFEEMLKKIKEAREAK